MPGRSLLLSSLLHRLSLIQILNMQEFETELKNAADDATKTLPEDEAKRR